MRRFYLHKRAGIYYAELINQSTGRKLPAKSTGEREKDEARDIVREWLRTGVPSSPTRKPRPAEEVFTLASILSGIRSANLTPTDAEKIAEAMKTRGLLLSYTTPGGQGAELFNDFLKRFWSFENSPYVAEKLAHGQRMTREHCQHSLSRARVHWFPAFDGRRLAELTKGDIKAFSVSLADTVPALAPATRNLVLLAGTAPLRWAFENGLISSDITSGLVTFSGEAKTRGVPTPEEARDLFALGWADERARIGSLVAATTGLRLGEIRALRGEDIGELVLHVRHAWTDEDGLKTPKNGETRRVPLLPSVRAELLALMGKNPNGRDGFIFWAPLDDTRPCAYHTLADGFKLALVNLRAGPNPTEEERKEAEEFWTSRAITFHSWRHYYAARMADKLEARTLMLATGHKTRAVFDHYADHALESDLTEAGDVAAEVFGNLLPFKAASGALGKAAGSEA